MRMAKYFMLFLNIKIINKSKVPGGMANAETGEINTGGRKAV